MGKRLYRAILIYIEGIEIEHCVQFLPEIDKKRLQSHGISRIIHKVWNAGNSHKQDEVSCALLLCRDMY